MLRNLLAHVGPSQRAIAAAAIRTVFTRENQAAARRLWRHVADGLRERFERLAVILHRIWRDGTEFRWGREAPLTA